MTSKENAEIRALLEQKIEIWQEAETLWVALTSEEMSFLEAAYVPHKVVGFE